MVAEKPELAQTLEPSNDCQGYVTFRGTKYIGNFDWVSLKDGKATGILKISDWSQQSPFSDRQIPVGDAQSGHIEFDPEEGMFRGVLDDKLPCTGDRAYTQYHGREFEGVLRLRGDKTHIHFGCVEPEDQEKNWGYHNPENTRGLTVGYDGQIVWDEERNMYRAPADSD